MRNLDVLTKTITIGCDSEFIYSLVMCFCASSVAFSQLRPSHASTGQLPQITVPIRIAMMSDAITLLVPVQAPIAATAQICSSDFFDARQVVARLFVAFVWHVIRLKASMSVSVKKPGWCKK